MTIERPFYGEIEGRISTLYTELADLESAVPQKLRPAEGFGWFIGYGIRRTFFPNGDVQNSKNVVIALPAYNPVSISQSGFLDKLKKSLVNPTDSRRSSLDPKRQFSVITSLGRTTPGYLEAQAYYGKFPYSCHAYSHLTTSRVGVRMKLADPDTDPSLVEGWLFKTDGSIGDLGSDFYMHCGKVVPGLSDTPLVRHTLESLPGFGYGNLSVDDDGTFPIVTPL